MAIGADRAILVETDANCSPGRGQAPQSPGRQRTTQLVILGKQAIDDDANQTGQMLAAWQTCPRPPSPARLNWPLTKPA